MHGAGSPIGCFWQTKNKNPYPAHHTSMAMLSARRVVQVQGQRVQKIAIKIRRETMRVKQPIVGRWR